MYTIYQIRENSDLIKNYKCKDIISLICGHCNLTYNRTKSEVVRKISPSRKVFPKSFCSKRCQDISRDTKMTTNCKHCNSEFKIGKSQFERRDIHFCSLSCRAIYFNKNKTHGNRRSKLEIWLEEQLINLYPNIEFHFNRKDSINSELDIYIPSMKLAFELNGIFHYEPIYGSDKLTQIQNNDNNKFQKCQELGISLCIIDASSQKRFTEKSSKKYLDIIIKIINDFK